MRCINPARVAYAHDLMADEYDQCDDLWYPWLFAQIHDFIVADLSRDPPDCRVAIDAGCGTGFQSFLLAQAGFQVHAFDLANALVARARDKSDTFAVTPLQSPPLFQADVDLAWLANHHKRLREALESLRQGRRVVPPRFRTGDVTTFDYASLVPNVIVCCGSVLSFVDDYCAVLQKMAHALAPGGRIYLEVEQRVNGDLVWPAIDNLLGGRIGYQQTWRGLLRNLFARPGRAVRIDYPFELHTGEEVILPMWLFSVSELHRLFDSVDLRVRDRLGIHHVTNILPSPWLHRSPPSRRTMTIFEPLRVADGSLGRVWPFARLGCSVMYSLEKPLS